MPLNAPNPFWPQNHWPGDQFSIVSDICSISSIALTAYLTITARKIKRQLQYRERLTRYQSKIISHRDQLGLYGSAFLASAFAIDTEIARITGNIVSFKRELKDIESDSITSVIAAIKSYQSAKTDANFQNVCENMNILVTVIENRVQGLMWEV